MSDVKLGQLIDDNARRDAIHIAIAPVVASDDLEPGQPISFVRGSTEEVCVSGRPIGIVDPFLTKLVSRGQRFYMLLMPNTVTSLRHEWTHPAFPIQVQYNVSQSEQWIRDFADRIELEYTELLNAAREYLKDGRCLYGGSNLEGESVPDKFWDHFEAVTGERVLNDDRGSFFRCGC